MLGVGGRDVILFKLFKLLYFYYKKYINSK